MTNASGTMKPLPPNTAAERLEDYEIDALTEESAKDIVRQLQQRLILAEEAKKTAESDNAAKSKFLAKASHDLRQPLHAMGLFTSSLLEMVTAGVERGDAKFAKVLTNIEHSSQAMEGLIENLFDLSKLEAQVTKPEIQSIKVADILERVGTRYQPMAKEKGIDLRVAPTEAIVLSDRVLLEKMLNNLVANGIAFTEAGKVLLEVKVLGSETQIIVSDTGIGIAEDAVKSAMRPFVRLEPQPKNRRPGLGAGLSIVERAVSLLHHRFQINSHLGEGTVCTLTVPTGFVDAQTTPAQPQKNSAKGQFLVCAIDDDDLVIEAMEMLFDGWGYGLLSAFDLKDALEKIAKNKPLIDLLLVDYRLGGTMNGIEAIDQLRAILPNPLPAIIVTGDTDSSIAAEAKAHNCLLMHKPLQAVKLRQVIRNAQAGRLPV